MQRSASNKPFDRPASIEDVARAAQVSTATVSRVLNTPERVAVVTAARVQKAIDELGYRPNVFAQGLMTRKSHLLGLLLPDLHGEFYSELLRGADAEARQAGYHVLVSSDGRETDAALFNSNIVGMLAGLAVMITEPNAYLVREAAHLKVPLVVIDKDLSGKHTDRVLVDNRTGMLEAVNLLLARLQPCDVYFLGGPSTNFDTAERAAVFAEALKQRGIQPSEDQLQYGSYSADWGYRAGSKLITQARKRPIGVLAGNDEIAFGVMQAAQELDVGVPGGVEIIGFDDTRITTMLRPNLTAVRVPTSEVGAAAMRLLIQRVANPDAPGRTITLPTKLIVRGSTKA